MVRVLLVPTILAAQQSERLDSTARDSVQRLETIEVIVTRAAEPLERVPTAIGLVGKDDIRGAQATLGLDEALNDLPGVYVANRYNFSLDQRLSIRSFGSRSNFGTRGRQDLTRRDTTDAARRAEPPHQRGVRRADRIEVLRGSGSSLYGNASGGVISLRSEPADPGLCWRVLEPRIQPWRLTRLRLDETENNYVEYEGQ